MNAIMIGQSSRIERPAGSHRRLAALLCVTLCAPAVAEDRGKLLIIGGGMTAAMAEKVYGVLADALPPDATVAYLPTAGEKPTTQSAVDGRLARSLKGRKLKLIDLTTANAAKADDATLAGEIAACDAVFFGGGAQSRIVKVLRPDGRETLAAKAVQAVLDKGGVVAGTSAGAAIMSDPMIMMGDSAKALADPASLPIGRGMGYFRYGLADQHFLQRGRFGRLVVAMERTNQNFGFGISEARALWVDRVTGTLTTIGTDAVVFVDRSRADGRANWRVSLLGNGDTIDGKTGKITPADHRRPAPTIIDLPPTGPEVADPWAKFAVGNAIHEMIRGVHRYAKLVDKSQTFDFTYDFETDHRRSGRDMNDVCVMRLRMTIEPTPATQPAR